MGKIQCHLKLFTQYTFTNNLEVQADVERLGGKDTVYSEGAYILVKIHAISQFFFNLLSFSIFFYSTLW